METVKKTERISIAFINDKTPILDNICKDLTTLGIETLFRSENLKNELSQLSELKKLPKVCIIDLDFYDKNVLLQLQKLKTKYPSIKLIAHNDNDSEKTIKSLLKFGFDGYLLIGSDTDDFKKAIEEVANGGRYFSVGVAKIVQEYFGDK